MAENNGAAEAAPAQINVLVQYTRDLSFENPNAPLSLQPKEASPQISINVNVNGRPLSDTDYEVQLKLEGQAGEGKDLLFKFDLDYAGVFRLTNIPKEHLGMVVMIECPRLLFPFARQIVAEAIRNGGFPPLYIDPIDFAALYQQRIAAETANQQPA